MKRTALTTAFYLFLSSAITTTFAAKHKQPTNSSPCCLNDTEANTIATEWLHIWWTGAISHISDLSGIVSQDIASYDEAFGDPTFGIQALFDEITAPGNSSTTNVKQFPLFTFHSCDQIAARWEYSGVTTGYDSTVPVGTPVEFKGTDLLHVNLTTRLIYNATSTADWISLARQLGGTCNV